MTHVDSLASLAAATAAAAIAAAAAADLTPSGRLERPEPAWLRDEDDEDFEEEEEEASSSSSSSFSSPSSSPDSLASCGTALDLPEDSFERLPAAAESSSPSF